MFARQSVQLAIEPPSSSQLGKVTRMKSLTPVDFAAVARQNRFLRIRSSEDFLTALEAECGLKEGEKAGIGFLN
ncbi:MAG: hypothetical protein BWK72_19450 [Rhodoferax ferrireducens]|uniref:Uncharacterized protein n=1 Tax=Rhodoferax ferrireducens TaxID=192843 RepID=A0A1W9KPC5_9BURK|nr:MAG: hypothetical protein BWK72_19450 [Rhodoferax ferrireducens]